MLCTLVECVPALRADNWLFVHILAHADIRSGKRRRHATETASHHSADSPRLVAIISDILQSTEGMEFSVSVAGMT